MRILVLTTLYPNAAMPAHGIFVENRLRAFQELSGADIRVIAPVPWFPSKQAIFRSWAKWAQVPTEEIRHGISITHPRYKLIPKMGMSLAPTALEGAFTKAATQILATGWDFDLIDAHYFYPDGIAAQRLAQKLGKPVTITARGTDINFIPNAEVPKKLILNAAAKADANITVAEALRSEMIKLGATPEKIMTLRNGVDLDLFTPKDRDAIRGRMNLKDKVILSVGHLIERKGHHLVIEALEKIPNATLLIAGSGPELNTLKQQAVQFKISDRVRFLGSVPHEQLPDLYSASDVLALASSREGWPNVLLEAMACGCPCVASPVWGSGEVITQEAAGSLAKARTAEAMGATIKALLASPPERNATRAYAEQFSWQETAEKIHTLFKNIIAAHTARNSIVSKPALIKPENKKPTFIVTIDTEECFSWDSYDYAGYQICSPDYINRFQLLCETESIKPIYFITQPLMKNQQTAAYYKNLHNTSAASLGLHLHQWVTEPDGPYNTPWYSFQKNLPLDIHRQKLMALVSSFQEAFGFNPTLHRAGRYGIAPENYQLLAEFGITHDFSPSAGFDFTNEGGPNFSTMSNKPFHIETVRGDIAVIPVTGAQALHHTRKFINTQKQIGFASTYPKTSLIDKAPRIPVRLSPEGASIEDMRALAKYLVDKQTPIITFTLHSTSLTPGASTYAPTEKDVDVLLDRSEKLFKSIRNDWGGAFATSEDLKSSLTR